MGEASRQEAGEQQEHLGAHHPWQRPIVLHSVTSILVGTAIAQPFLRRADTSFGWDSNPGLGTVVVWSVIAVVVGGVAWAVGKNRSMVVAVVGSGLMVSPVVALVMSVIAVVWPG